MADNAETGRENNDEFARAVETGKAEARKAIEEDAKKGPDVKEAQESLAKEYLAKLKAVHDDAMRYHYAKDKDKEKDKGKKNQKTLIEAAAAAKEGIEIISNKPKNQALLSQLAEKKIGLETAAAIQTYLGDYILGEKDINLQPQDQPKSDFQKAYERLREQDEAAAERVREAMGKRSTDFGVANEDEVRERLQPEKSPEAAKVETSEDQYQKLVEQSEEQHKQSKDKFDAEGNWENDEIQYYGRFTKVQRDFLHDLYSADRFLDRIDKEVGEAEGKNIEEKREAASKTMIRQVNTIMTQLYVSLQLEAPKKFFEEIAQADYLSGIVPTTEALKRNLTRVLRRLEELEETGDERAKNAKMYIDSEEKTYTTEKEVTFDRITGKKIEKDVKLSKPVSRLEPLTRAKTVGVSDFMTSVITNLNHLQHRQEYFHNVRAIFNQPPGEQGFYGQLAGYAEKLSGTDIDEIMLLPDGPLVYEAFILYDKLVEEDFAKLDWKHRPNQFSNQLERVNSQLENEVFDLLKQDHGGKYSDIELRNALNIAVGMSRGVFMNEPEKSAYADAVDATGKGMIASYGTNDAAALNPFNPLHTIMRWQSENVVTPYYFLPVNRMDKGEKMSWKGWDHNKLWDSMLKYRDSYTQGRGDLADKELLIDKLIDICNVGGPAKRRGWRMLYTTKDYYEYYKEDDNKYGHKKGEMDVLKTFKALENIGYEVINDFFDNQIPDEFKKAEIKGEKLEFFKYLYQNYFEGFEDGDLNSYLNNLRREQRAKAIDDIKKGFKSPASIDEQTEINVANEFMMRALSYEIAWRFPSKLLKMDRDRFQKDGISRWRNVQKQSGLSRDDFDAVMKDLAFAETLLRKEMSENMRKIVEEKVRIDPKFRLCDLGEINNKLSKEKIRDLFGKKIPEDRIKRVMDIYELIEKTYLRDKEFMKEIGPKIDEYTFTFGLEDTDFSFMIWRGAGPRIIPRAIGDIGQMEREVIPVIIDMPWKLHDMAVNGKHDFSPVIEYLKKARATFWNVHGPGDAMDEFMYQIAASTIAYFKKDTVAKPLFGLFGIGRKNSLAAQVAGRSTAVWEWDSRDIDRFCVALESNHLLRNAPYDLSITKMPAYEPVWLNIFGKAIKTPFKKRVIDYKWNSKRLRKEFGGSWKDMVLESINQFLPLILLAILWKYIQESLKEAEGKKK